MAEAVQLPSSNLLPGMAQEESIQQDLGFESLQCHIWAGYTMYSANVHAQYAVSHYCSIAYNKPHKLCVVSFILQFWCDFSVLVNVVFLYVCQSKYRNADCFNNLKCRLYSVLSRIKNQAVLNYICEMV